MVRSRAPCWLLRGTGTQAEQQRWPPSDVLPWNVHADRQVTQDHGRWSASDRNSTPAQVWNQEDAHAQAKGQLCLPLPDPNYDKENGIDLRGYHESNSLADLLKSATDPCVSP